MKLSINFAFTATTAAALWFIILSNAGQSVAQNTTVSSTTEVSSTSSVNLIQNQTSTATTISSEMQTTAMEVTTANTNTTVPDTTNKTTLQPDNDLETTIAGQSTFLFSTAAAVTMSSALPLNVSSIQLIEVLSNSNETQVLLMNLELTTHQLFESLVNYTKTQTSSTKQILLNSTEGEMLLELIRTNASVILGEYAKDIQNESDQVFMLALLLDFQLNLHNSSFVENLIEATVHNNPNSTYSLDYQRLTTHICEIYNNASGTAANSCEMVTTATEAPKPTEVPVALIVGCVVGAGAFIILTIAVVGYACTKSSAAGKIAPSDEVAFSRPDSKSNCFSNDSLASSAADQHSR